MSRIVKELEMRGMQRKDLIKYFEDIGGKALGNSKYYCESWEVEICHQVFCDIGPMKIPSTKVIFFIDESIYDEFLYKFRLKFLCAGA